MNVLLISQCSGRALPQTRRILDQFAERCGERTWQTPITQAGLNTLRKLLRKTARKNTAVACHWIRGRDHRELMWIVGSARRFNAEGTVPTNTTTRNVLRSADENDWHSAEDIRLLAQLAALLHDLGKASIAFQERLHGTRQERNLYRHEWVSLRLFQAFVHTGGDADWLERLANPADGDEQAWLARGRYQRDGVDAVQRYPFRDLPPLAAAVAWLVVTHHRLPVVPVDQDDGTQAWLGKRSRSFDLAWLETPLTHVSHDWNEVRQTVDCTEAEPYWNTDGPLPVIQPAWRTQAARLARRFLQLRQRRHDDWLHNPYVMHLARLSLMLADHHYSSLGTDNNDKPVAERQRFVQNNQSVFANTLRPAVMNQSLLEHLLGVGYTAGLIAHALPNFEHHLPRLVRHRGLRKRSADARFAWQDKAVDAATAMRERAQEQGAFIINMASTGCGKTLANARILYALTDPQQGVRFTYALGLRTLTLQTGHSYRNDLHLGEDELAIMVGGAANRALFEFYERKAETRGSASIQSLVEEDTHVLYEGSTTGHPLLSRAFADPLIKRLLSAPILACTVDHVTPATESLRAGRQIAPMLRLMSGDLVLDELDDFGLDDLPALTRLVHWAGMLGTRVVLSSATLPPALVQGMFQAYRAGRKQYQRNRGAAGGQQATAVDIPCLWTDEFGTNVAPCADAATFEDQHHQFVDRRAKRLKKDAPLRRGALLPLQISASQPDQVHASFARHVHEACLRLHADHAQTDPVSGKHVSFGLVRMANINPLFDVATKLFELGSPDNTHIHLCVYHARFPLLQRSAIEHQLDTIFNRRGDNGQAVYQLPHIRAAIDAHPGHNHLFVVLASPVCEVGRDWDADWAVAEPSSMRSLIQLAGRVQRHRQQPASDAPNILIFDTNLKHFRPGKGADGRPRAAFVRPGFEKDAPQATMPFRLASHRLDKLLEPSQYQVLNALPRVHPSPRSSWQPKQKLVDLEQARIHASMLPPEQETARSRGPAAAMERDQAAYGWLYPQAALTGMLPQQQPFRADASRSVKLTFLPDDDEEHLRLHRVESDPNKRGQDLYVEADQSQLHRVDLTLGPRIHVWGKHDLMSLLTEQAEDTNQPLIDCAKRQTTVDVQESNHGWRYHPWLGFSQHQ